MDQQEKIDYFLSGLPPAEADKWFTSDNIKLWTEMGEPKTWDEYQKKVSDKEKSDKEWNEMSEGEKNESWSSTIPPAFLEKWSTPEGYNEWIAQGMPRTWDELKAGLSPQLASILKRDGWI